MSSVLLVNDMVGFGNLGMSAMVPILSVLKYKLFRLPTSLVSNNFSYGQFAVLDTTDYMRQSIEIWERQAFPIDAVITGYLVSEEQTKLVADYCSVLKRRGTRIFVDPIMADDGKLYNGATSQTIDYMRSMCRVADVILPNMTEAQLLADYGLGQRSLSAADALELIHRLHALCHNSVVISSMVIDQQTCTMLYDAQLDCIKTLPYTLIPAQFSGTGDMFSAILMDRYLKGKSLEHSVQSAMNFVSRMIEINRDYPFPDNGIPIEQYLDEVGKM
ncbi:MAG: bifunctional hydroxymethylpyrimidine kinase/phosphomethylpyrimidine kinase [Bacteroidales bacterium]|nr:bifunctional hydroxymethylpyrimidine kinase/phosphomethylpyrimidine kinase [Bacteroidales bacterium]